MVRPRLCPVSRSFKYSIPQPGANSPKKNTIPNYPDLPFRFVVKRMYTKHPKRACFPSSPNMQEGSRPNVGQPASDNQYTKRIKIFEYSKRDMSCRYLHRDILLLSRSHFPMHITFNLHQSPCWASSHHWYFSRWISGQSLSLAVIISSRVIPVIIVQNMGHASAPSWWS